MAAGAIDDEILAVGRDVAARFPSAARRPLKALDDKAMDLASQDEQLRAALFRFVDVVPACRSLDDLARHLTGFLDEVPDRPPPLEVAMRMSGTKAGRAALGAAAAAGVRHMAHRFIVGETPRDATKILQELWRSGAAACTQTWQTPGAQDAGGATPCESDSHLGHWFGPWKALRPNRTADENRHIPGSRVPGRVPGFGNILGHFRENFRLACGRKVLRSVNFSFAFRD